MITQSSKRDAKASIVFSTLAAKARPLILAEFNADSCIAATRVVIDVLKHFHIPAYGLAVNCSIFSPNFVAAVEAGERPPEEREQLGEWLDKFKAHSVGLGMPGGGERGKWGTEAGHVVAAVPTLQTFVDASLDQCNRPEKQIVLPGVITVRVESQAFFADEELADLMCNGSLLMYRARPAEKEFMRSTNWKSKSLTRAIVKTLIAEIEERRTA